MNDSLPELAARGVFIALFAFTAVDFVRRREPARLEVAALFASLAAISLLALATSAPGWASMLAVMAVLAQPYLLLRLLGHFRPLRTAQHVLGVLGVAVAWLLMLGYQMAPPTWAQLAIAIAFVAGEGYAAFEFLRAALTTRGLTHRRLVAVAVGSACLAAALICSVAGPLLPPFGDILNGTAGLAALASAVAYLIGFVPPRWLRRAWQRDEIERFLIGLAGQSSHERVTTALDYLGQAAARATGGLSGVVALTEPPGQTLRVHIDPWSKALLDAADVTTLTADQTSPALSRARQRRGPVASAEPAEWGPALRRLAAAAGGARVALIAPLTASAREFGVFIVLVQRAPLFVEDDLVVLEVLAEQAALAIESRRLIEAVTRERTTLAAVMASMHDGLVVADPDGEVRYCNARAEALLSAPRGALVGRPASSALDGVPSLEPSASRAWRRALTRPGSTATLEFGESPRSEVLVHSFVVNDESRAQPAVGLVLRDVTAERDLARTKDELVSVVSHELRTPLASVVGFAELLLTRELPEAQRQQFVTVIAEEGRRLTALINDFLDLQRMESGRQEIAPRETRLDELVRRAVTAAGDDAARPIFVELAPDLPAVRADDDRILQVLTNLLSNARKYSPNGGRVHVTAWQAEGQVTVAVQDQGLGLPPEAQTRLFEKFYRVDNSDRRSIKGTGLGLTISRKIVEAHGGRIWAESAGLRHGSRFLFTLPLAEARATSGEVLIVEDDAGFARLMAAELAERGLSSVRAESVEEAIGQLDHERPGAVVLDLLLGGSEGEQFLRRLRSSGGFDVPVVVVTVKDLSREEREVLEDLRVLAILRKGAGVASAASDVVVEALALRTAAAERKSA